MSLGWVLKSTRKSVGFVENFKVCISKTFMEGEETGRKTYRSYDASKFKTLQTATGEVMFVKEEWLVANQVTRYFSRLSTHYRSAQLDWPGKCRAVPHKMNKTTAWLREKRFSLDSKEGTLLWSNFWAVDIITAFSQNIFKPCNSYRCLLFHEGTDPRT